MALVDTIGSPVQFITRFRDMGRGNQFSVEALEALFEYLWDMSEDMGEPVEMDVIAICCDFTEMDADEVIDQYTVDVEDCEDEDERQDAAREYLQDNTALVGETSQGFIFQQF